MRKNRALSSIELTILGLTWLRGPCTTYAVMKELGSSESSYYKSRAGTTYSVADRLMRFGLIERLESDDTGTENLICVTRSGVATLKGWFAPPLPIADIAHSADLIRLRFFFLGVIDHNERLAFIEDALVGLRKHLVRCEGLIPANEEIGDRFGALATLSVILETKARIEWLETVRDSVREIT